MVTEEQKKFLEGYEFLRLGRAIHAKQWQQALMICNSMDKKLRELKLDELCHNVTQLRAALLHKNEVQAENQMALLTAKRVQLRKSSQLSGAVPE